jgi:hypothetical protein
MALDASLQNAGRVPADAATRRRRAARPFFFDERGTDPDAADNNWPKTVVYLAGWGFGHGTLNGKPRYENYEMHFMVTQEIRDRKTLRVNYPMANKRSPAGEVNPAILEDDQRH